MPAKQWAVTYQQRGHFGSYVAVTTFLTEEAAIKLALEYAVCGPVHIWELIAKIDPNPKIEYVVDKG